MRGTEKDPVDHARTTRPHAGETMKDAGNLPALALMLVALVSFVGCLAAFGTSRGGIGVWLAVVAVVLFVVSGLWFGLEHRRIRRKERQWNVDHASVDHRMSGD